MQYRSYHKRDSFGFGDDFFMLEHYTQLREIVIHDYNYCACSSFSLLDLPVLHRLVVDDHSFYSDEGNYKGSFSVIRCPSLETITIGDSFCDYSRCVVKGGLYSHS